jgi:hypothetical protein
VCGPHTATYAALHMVCNQPRQAGRQARRHRYAQLAFSGMHGTGHFTRVMPLVMNGLRRDDLQAGDELPMNSIVEQRHVAPGVAPAVALVRSALRDLAGWLAAVVDTEAGAAPHVVRAYSCVQAPLAALVLVHMQCRGGGGGLSSSQDVAARLPCAATCTSVPTHGDVSITNVRQQLSLGQVGLTVLSPPVS